MLRGRSQSERPTIEFLSLDIGLGNPGSKSLKISREKTKPL